MTGFIIRRLGQAVVVTFGVTLITFGLLHLLPGSIARDILGNRATPQAIAQFNHQHGFDRPVFVQYWIFLKELFGGQLWSYQYNRTVNSLIVSELPRDVILGGLSLIFSLIIAIPIGIIQAVRRNGIADYAGTTVSFVLWSMPQYAVALLLIQLLAISFHVFPAEAPQGPAVSSALQDPQALVLPVLALTLTIYAQFSRYMRSSAIDTLAQDYMRTARAKGLPERLVLSRHLLRNSLLTVVTLVGLNIPLILTGTLIIEQVFNYPGVGLEYLTATLSNDYEVMLEITVIVGLVTVIGNLMADIGYAILDPRIRY
jgi:peptide/nickel transport system permease protein